ncbi:MAG: restriction endonuclease subunit S [Dolichospermum sp. JUN01]|nr:restriction endonuclease subunit S [Dolichospermum sp. JUN01]
MKWLSVDLELVADNIRNGLTVKQSSESSGLPISRIETISNWCIDTNRVGYANINLGEKDNWLLKIGDILFSHINSEPYIGKSAIYTGNPKYLIHGMNLLCIRLIQEIILPEYFFYLTKSSKFRSQLPGITKRAINQASISIGDLNKIKVPLPPPSEQRRIVEILDQADALRKMRAEADAKSDRILPALFIKMFGDPSTNPMGWDIVLVEKLFSKERSGTKCGPFGSALKKHEYVDNGVPVWGIDNIKPNQFLESGSLFITPTKYEELKSYTVEPGDIIISRAGTVGRMCVAQPQQSPSIISTNLIRLTLDKNIFLLNILRLFFHIFQHQLINYVQVVMMELIHS